MPLNGHLRSLVGFSRFILEWISSHEIARSYADAIAAHFITELSQVLPMGSLSSQAVA